MENSCPSHVDDQLNFSCNLNHESFSLLHTRAVKSIRQRRGARSAKRTFCLIWTIGAKRSSLQSPILTLQVSPSRSSDARFDSLAQLPFFLSGSISFRLLRPIYSIAPSRHHALLQAEVPRSRRVGHGASAPNCRDGSICQTSAFC